uniref:Ferric-chelate reductase 1a n=1 Tax=Cyclopterus lumpus TaxID=8103 RepID=A0A8C3A9G5_CYCLU
MPPVGLGVLLLISVSVCYWVPAGCYANGKVTKVCGSMEPHHDVHGQTAHSPYHLETNTTTFSPGESIKVILTGTSFFEGFLLQARDAANQGSVTTVGTFTLTNRNKAQLLTCNKHQDSAVSHTSNARQTEVCVIWNAPADAPKQVQFFVSVVTHYNVFWVKLPGPVIYQHGVAPHPPQSDTTPPPVQPTTTPTILTGQHCCPSLCVCLQFGLSSVLWRLADGAIQCRFSRPVKLVNQEAARYDLDQDYFLFLTNGHAQYGKVWKHSHQPLISTHNKRITGPPEVLRGSRGPIIMKMHGALMLLAWMLTGSVGTVIASFYKPDWPNQTLLGQKVWFQVHRGLMVLTVTLTIVAFCLPFFYRKGWSKVQYTHCKYIVLHCSCIAVIYINISNLFVSLSRRYIFNWAHWGIGSVTEIMAVAAMFLGIRQSSLPLPQPWATHVLIGYVTWLASFRIEGAAMYLCVTLTVVCLTNSNGVS